MSRLDRCKPCTELLPNWRRSFYSGNQNEKTPQGPYTRVTVSIDNLYIHTEQYVYTINPLLASVVLGLLAAQGASNSESADEIQTK